MKKRGIVCSDSRRFGPMFLSNSSALSSREGMGVEDPMPVSCDTNVRWNFRQMDDAVVVGLPMLVDSVRLLVFGSDCR